MLSLRVRRYVGPFNVVCVDSILVQSRVQDTLGQIFEEIRSSRRKRCTSFPRSILILYDCNFIFKVIDNIMITVWNSVTKVMGCD